MIVEHSNLNDFGQWLALAKEVEPLFGPMVDDENFRTALENAISSKNAFCIRLAEGEQLGGGIIISKDLNEIVWLAVSAANRKKGCGRKLIEFALKNLKQNQDIWVQTFDNSVEQGKAARKLYADFGFIDDKSAGLNPAGIPTVIMKRSIT